MNPSLLISRSRALSGTLGLFFLFLFPSIPVFSTSAQEKNLQREEMEAMQREMRLLNRKILQLQGQVKGLRNPKSKDLENSQERMERNTKDNATSQAEEPPSPQHSPRLDTEDDYFDESPSETAENLPGSATPTNSGSQGGPRVISIDDIIADLPQGWVMGTVPPSPSKARADSGPGARNRGDTPRSGSESGPASSVEPKGNPSTAGAFGRETNQRAVNFRQAKPTPEGLSEPVPEDDKASGPRLLHPEEAPATPDPLPEPHALPPGATLQGAKKLLQEEKFAKARAVFLDLLQDKTSREYPSVMYWFGMLNLRENHLDQAALWFDKTLQFCATSGVLEEQKLCVSALLRLSTTLLRQNNMDRARHSLLSCQKRARPLLPFLPDHIKKGIKTMRSLLKSLAKDQDHFQVTSHTLPAGEKGEVSKEMGEDGGRRRNLGAPGEKLPAASGEKIPEREGKGAGEKIPPNALQKPAQSQLPPRTSQEQGEEDAAFSHGEE